ncbi:hypothetical protein Osc7112_1085 [Oscillatoria nigro-viridis PCC 7112]|uniref:Uncharacterized protein n=1 Tax=Phormidium nigroviride PCC 7112 TaxID=179408 RepID=K9VEH5_9CYAN|nr:hypothetical protein Osc7112_1085 [Oscillatoria nigro-viridis PCC 7112]
MSISSNFVSKYSDLLSLPVPVSIIKLARAFPGVKHHLQNLIGLYITKYNDKNIQIDVS